MEYKYLAKNRSGETINGEIDANSEGEVGRMLTEKELFVVDIKPLKKSPLLLRKKITLKDKIVFTKELAMMIKGGLPLIDSLQALEEQAENPEFSQIIKKVSIDIKGGAALSQALAKFPKVFPELYISITASGEQSGKLDEVLERLAEQLQKDYDLNNRVKNATTYPIVVVLALIGIMIIMLVFVVPKLQNIFMEMGVELPLPTRILLNTSKFLVNYWYLTILGIGILYYAIRFWAKTPDGSIAIGRFKIKVPIFGNLMRQIYLARFSRTMGTLIASGLPMLDIIETVEKVVGNKIYTAALIKIRKDIENGVPLSTSMRKYNTEKLFPSMVCQMTAMGEKSGKVDYVFFDIADFYDKEVEVATANMASLIEPILILIIGAGVGLAIASVIMPIYSLVNVL